MNPKAVYLAEKHERPTSQTQDPSNEKMDYKRSKMIPLPEEPKNIEYEKIKPSKPQEIDFESILTDQRLSKFNKDLDKEHKSKSKFLSQTMKKEGRKKEVTPKMILSSFSVDLINSFRESLQKKFQHNLNELEKQRRVWIEKLFKYLCYGLQQIYEFFIKDKDSKEKLNNVKKEDFVRLLQKKVIKIDQELLNAHNIGKTQSSSIRLKNQWKFLIEIVIKKENSKLRQAIITGKINPSFLVYAKQIDLIDYLSPERQHQLKLEVDGILKDAESHKLKVDSNQKKGLDGTFVKQSQLEEVESCSTMEGSESLKSMGSKKCSTAKRSKCIPKVKQRMKQSEPKKLRKLNEKS